MQTFIAIVAVAFAALYTFAPFWQRLTGEIRPALPPSDRELWQRRKAEAYAAIKEAEFDRQTGKLSDTDFELLNSKFTKEALEAIAALDTQAPRSITGKPGKAAFCPSCGTAAGGKAKFCAACGTALHSLAA